MSEARTLPPGVIDALARSKDEAPVELDLRAMMAEAEAKRA